MMSRLVPVAALVLVLVGCAASSAVTTLTATEYPFYQNYLKRTHFKAFVRASVTEGQGLSHSTIYRSANPESAISRAMENCKKRQGTIEHGACQLHSLGNVDVSRLNEEELARAIAVYKKKRDFTSADLQLAAFERLMAPTLARPVQGAAPHTGDYCYRVRMNEMFELRGNACASDASRVSSAKYQEWRAAKTTFKIAFEQEQRSRAKK